MILMKKIIGEGAKQRLFEMRDLTSRQKKLLDAWYEKYKDKIQTGILHFDSSDCPYFSYDFYEELEKINDTEVLYQNINHYISDKGMSKVNEKMSRKFGDDDEEGEGNKNNFRKNTPMIYKEKKEEYPDAIRGEDLYVEWDDETDLWHVFGVDSGHSYANYTVERQAEEQMKNMLANRGKITESKKKKKNEDTLIPHKKSKEDKEYDKNKKDKEKENNKDKRILLTGKRITDELVEKIGKRLGIDWGKYKKDQFKKGLKVELEHGKKNPKTDVTHDDAILTSKIVLAHLDEDRDYYTKLKKVEEGIRKLVRKELRIIKEQINPTVVAEQLPNMKIYEIAETIGRDWKNVNFAAKPYLEAMYTLENISDAYGMDSGKSIVSYFLSNAATYKGEIARLVKTELKKRIK